MKHTKYFLIIVATAFSTLYFSCKKNEGLSNSKFPMTSNCEDGIKNGDEIGIDCGPGCSTCIGKMNASVGGVNWASTNVTSNATVHNDSLLILASSTDGHSSIGIIYTGQFKSGSFSIAQAYYQVNFPAEFYFTSSGSITFDDFDTSNKIIVKGSFSFIATDINSGLSKTISGIFQNLKY